VGQQRLGRPDVLGGEEVDTEPGDPRVIGELGRTAVSSSGSGSTTIDQ